MDFGFFTEFDRFDYVRAEENGKMGLLHRNGTWLLPPIFDYLQILQADLIHVRTKAVSYLCDRHGSFLQSVSFDYARRLCYHPPYYAVRRGQLWGIADAQFHLCYGYCFSQLRFGWDHTIWAMQNGVWERLPFSTWE